MEGILGNHDSGLETGSASIGSNRNLSSSETSGMDLSESNLQEDIPSDDDQGEQEDGFITNLNNSCSQDYLKNTLKIDDAAKIDSGFHEDHIIHQSSKAPVEDIELRQFTNVGESSGTSDFVFVNGDLSTNASSTKLDEDCETDFIDYEYHEKPNFALNKPLELLISDDTHNFRLKSSERSTNDERDIYSPEETDDLSFIRHEESAMVDTPDTIDDILEDTIQHFDDNKRNDQSRSSISTKEEKQRQNEEIVNLESSSISSETGSWESVFPMKNTQETRDICVTFLQNEQKYCSIFFSEQEPARSTILSNICDRDNEEEVFEMNDISQNDDTESKTEISPVVSVNQTPVKKNCFIDASSLYDEVEIPQYIPITLIHQGSCEAGTSGIKPTAIKSSESKHDNELPPQTAEFQLELSITETLKPFRNAKKVRRMDSTSSTSEDTSVREDISAKIEEPKIEFFADQDLNFHTQFQRCKIMRKCDDEVTSVSNQDTANDESDYESRKSGLIRRRTFELETDEDHAALLRQEYERRQGSLVFSNSIPQYSGHVIEPEIQNSKMIEECENISKIASLKNYKPELNDSYESRGYTSDGVIFPETPNNSIIQIDLQIEESQHENVMEVTKKTDNARGRYFNELQSNGIVDSPKKQSKYAESAPVLSGGVSADDFKPVVIYDSPLSRRKIESTPIISGGAVLDSEDTSNEPKKVKTKSTPCWIVDMSTEDPKSRRKSEGSAKFESDLQVLNIEEIPPQPSKNSTFFVDFGENNARKTSKNRSPTFKSDSDSTDVSKSDSKSESKKATGFYVDLSKTTTLKSPKSKTPVSATNDKKNIFSIFIDFNDESSAQKEMPNRLASSLYAKKNIEKTDTKNDSLPVSNRTDQMSKSVATMEKSNNGHSENKNKQSFMFIDFKENKSKQIEQLKSDFDVNSEEQETEKSSEAKNKGYFMFIESESPVIRRRVGSTSRASSKRHSWNTEPTPSETAQQEGHRQHKRAQSLSVDRNSLNDKFLTLQKAQGSTFSIDSYNSVLSDYSLSKSEMSSGSSNSNIDNKMTGSCYGRLPTDKKHRRDVKINETFDKSSPGSQTESILTKDNSPTSTETEDVTYQNENVEEHEKSPVKPLPDRPLQMETIVENKETVVQQEKKNIVVHTMETLQATIERQKKLLATVTETSEGPNDITKVNNDKFVRLSDLDKPMPKFDLLHDKLMSNSAGSNRMSKLFPDREFLENRSYMSRSIGNNITNLVTSLENSRSLSRLFPHLSKGFSNSLPSGVGTVNSFTRSPLDTEDLVSDISGTSSLSSSMGRSALDSTEDSLSKQPRRLGEDLLRMFLEEIAPDVTVEVGGRRMKAHKCILRSRCQYFAAILAGGWVQSAGNVISMQGFTYGAVHFALCHIYSGATTPPEGISLQELASLADLLGLEGLKEVTAHALKATYCHMFHKPCSECIAGVCQVLPLSLTYGLDELYRRAMRWVCRHFLKVWPTRPFSSLSTDIMDRSRHQIIAHLGVDNVLAIILDCEQLLATLPATRWASTIEGLTISLLESSHSYVTDHFASLLISDSFMSLGRDMSWNISRLEATLVDAANNLSPDQACRSYHRATRLSSQVHKTHANSAGSEEYSSHEDIEYHQEFIRLVDSLLGLVESCLVRQGARAMRVPAWGRLDPHLRRRIQDLACLGCPIERKSRSGSVRSSSSSRSQDLRQIRQAMHAQSKRASSQENQKNSNSNQMDIPVFNLSGVVFRSSSTDRQVYGNSSRYSMNLEKKIKPEVSMGTERLNNGTLDKSASDKSIEKAAAKSMTQGIEKSSSHKNILQTDVKSKNTNLKVEKVGTNKIHDKLTHQRSLSESLDPKQTTEKVKPVESSGGDDDINTQKPKSWTARLAEAKPRYLEPRKRDTKVEKPLTKNKKGISSSDSSRTSSPAALKNKQKAEVKQKYTSNNMSLDSLASPANGRGKLAPLKLKNDMEMSMDSLAESMSTSARTNDADAQESLLSNSTQDLNSATENKPLKKTTLTENLRANRNINKSNLSKSAPNMNKENLTIVKNNTKMNNFVSKSGTTSGNVRSPSSVVRNKTISSVTVSPHSRKSSGVSSNTNSPSLRRSLLTSKQEAPLNKNKITKTPLSNNTTLKNKSPPAPNKKLDVNVSSPNGQNKRITRLQTSQSLTSPTKASAAKIITTNKQKSNSGVIDIKRKPSSTVNKNKNSVKNETIDGEVLESKIIAHVERSGTFLKDEPTLLVSSVAEE